MIWTNVRFQNLCHNIKRSQQCQKKKKKKNYISLSIKGIQKISYCLFDFQKYPKFN